MCCILAGVSYVVKSVTLRTLCQLTMCASHVTPYVTVAMALMPTSARPVKTLGELYNYMQCVDFQKMFPLGKSCAWVDHFWLPKTRPPPPLPTPRTGYCCQNRSGVGFWLPKDIPLYYNYNHLRKCESMTLSVLYFPLHTGSRYLLTTRTILTPPPCTALGVAWGKHWTPTPPCVCRWCRSFCRETCLGMHVVMLSCCHDYIVHGFWPESENFDSAKKPSERSIPEE